MPLSLSTEEMDLLLSLAVPIEQHLRTERLTAVAAELEATGKPARSESVRSTERRARFNGAFSTRRRSHPTRRRRCTAAAPPDG